MCDGSEMALEVLGSTFWLLPSWIGDMWRESDIQIKSEAGIR